MQTIFITPDRVDGVARGWKPQRTPLIYKRYRMLKRKNPKVRRRNEWRLRRDKAFDRITDGIITTAKASAIAVALAAVVTGAAQWAVWLMGI